MKMRAIGPPSARTLAIVGFGLVAVVLAWVLFVGLPRWFGRQPQQASAPAATAVTPEAAAAAARRINAKLFYVGASGVSLVTVERDVMYAEDQLGQAREILRAQLEPPESPQVSAIPDGTELRSVFLTPRGEAYVDLTQDVVTGQRGGSVNELLTVYTIVHALTANLPAIRAVQILVDGREVETLAGHVNIQQPVEQNAAWIQ